MTMKKVMLTTKKVLKKHHFHIFTFLCVVSVVGFAYNALNLKEGFLQTIGNTNIRLGEWFQVPNSRMSLLDPCKDADCSYSGKQGQKGVVTAWSGGVFDSIRNQLVVWGGGNPDYGGNEVYAFSLDSLSWKRLSEPSIDAELIDGNTTVYADGMPRSRHTYDSLEVVPERNELCAFGMASAFPDGKSDSKKTQCFNLVNFEWENYSDNTGVGITNGAITARDQTTGKVYWHGGQSSKSGLMEYTPTTDSWKSVISSSIPSNLNATFHPEKKKMVAIGKGSVYSWDVVANKFTVLKTTGDTEIIKGNAPGFDYDPVSKMFVAWAGGANVYTLDLDTLIWKKYLPAETNVFLPSAQTPNGIFGRWKYVPEKDVFVGFNSVNGNVFIYKPGFNRQASASRPNSSVYEVGPNKPYKKPSELVKVVKDGDTVLIDPGVYENDIAIWRANDLTLRGAGSSRAHMKSTNGKLAQNKGIWIIIGKNTTIENLEFSGARSEDKNGAGIKGQNDLIIKNSYFHDNENGLFTTKGAVSIESSEFSNNGAGDGKTHNIYISSSPKFTIKYSFVHHPKMGSNIKSRALQSHILYNRLTDEESGSSAYSIDLSNGGLSYMMGNSIEQDSENDDPVVVSYGAEGLKTSGGKKNELYFINNTVVNNSGKTGAVFLKVKEKTPVAKSTNNLFLGVGKLFEGPVTSLKDLNHTYNIANKASFKYELDKSSTAINAGAPQNSANDISLTPTEEYVHPLGKRERKIIGNIDVGAYELK